MERDSIIEFAQKLVRTPSQAGVNNPSEIISLAKGFADSIDLPLDVVKMDDRPVALACTIKGAHPGPKCGLNACIDTAAVENADQWKRNPFSGDVQNGFLWGRGAADSKIGVSIFTHIAHELMNRRDEMHGDLVVIFDADEHTGEFNGIRTALESGYKPDYMMIGYPGNTNLVVGARGFSRYNIYMQGIPSHTGGARMPQDNVLVRMASLINTITNEQPVAEAQDDFPLRPKATVVEAMGGGSYSTIPTDALIAVDVRLTPAFNEQAADEYIQAILTAHDAAFKIPETRRTTMQKHSSEPHFSTPHDSPIRVAMRESIVEITGQEDLPEIICNPSNVGCFVSKYGVQALAGYGVPHKGMHALNERADLSALDEVYSVYKRTCERVLGMP